MRILTLFVRHGSEKYPAALEDLDALFARRLPAAERTTIVIDNALEPGHERRVSADRMVIGGDNRQWEFSGWDRALAHVGRGLFAFDLVHLCTSAFGTHYTAYLDRLSDGLLRAVRGRGIALGHVDYFPAMVRVRSYGSQHWLRTCFLFAAPEDVATVGPLAAVHDRSALFSGDPADPFRPDAPLSANYRTLIVDWLTGAGTGQGVAWHSRFDLTEATRRLFEDKAVALLNEHLLSIRLRAQGCRVVDVTWADGALEAGALPAAIPEWRQQLVARPVDAKPELVSLP